MPIEAEYIIRYHSLYLYHSSESYDYLLDDDDILMKHVVKDFNQYDLYTKNDANLNSSLEDFLPQKNSYTVCSDNLSIKWTFELREYYTNLVKKYISKDLMIYYLTFLI